MIYTLLNSDNVLNNDSNFRFEPPIDNAHDLLESKVPWVADDEAWILSFVNSDNEFFKELSRQFEVMTPAEIRRRSQLRQIALIVERITGGISGGKFTDMCFYF